MEGEGEGYGSAPPLAERKTMGHRRRCLARGGGAVADEEERSPSP
jgi:hypothetical protein